MYRPSPEQQRQNPPDYISFQYSQTQEDFKHDILAAHNRIAKQINEWVTELREQLAEGMVQPCRGLDIAKMKGQINYMLDHIDLLSTENHVLRRQLRLLELLVDGVDLAETIGVGFAANRIRDVILGTGDGGGLKEELANSGFPLEKYTDFSKADGNSAASEDSSAEQKVDNEDDQDLSPRLVNLNHQLRLYLSSRQQQGDAKCRILVFVNTRTTVNALRGYLTRHYPELKPNFVVGHGGQGGQSWGEGDIGSGQAAIIKDFHKVSLGGHLVVY